MTDQSGSTRSGSSEQRNDHADAVAYSQYVHFGVDMAGKDTQADLARIIHRRGSRDLLVIAPGAKVTLPGNPEIDARVLAVEIKAASVMYRVAWFAGGVRYAEWLEQCEIEALPEKTKFRKIGFMHSQQQRQ